MQSQNLRITKLASAIAMAVLGCGVAMLTIPAYAHSAKVLENDRVYAAPNPAASPQQSTQTGTSAATTGKSTVQKKKDQNPVTLQTVEVVGSIINSLEFSTDAKRNATNITDTIFSQGIGQLPYITIANSLNSVPGVQLTRSSTGQGIKVSIRGLGSMFTETTLDGAPVQTSALSLTQQNNDRSVMLNIFPSQFFSQIKITKSPEASEVEGGVTGNVNLQTLRPFDDPGTHVTYDVGLTMSDALNTNTQPQGSLIGSWTNEAGTFGILAGIASQREEQQFKEFGSVGWTTPGLTYAQCGLTPPAGIPADVPVPPEPACNSAGGGNWTIPGTVPATAGAGLTPGQAINENFLLSHNPGLTISQLSNALIPRLASPIYVDNTTKLGSSILSLEARPNEDVDAWLTFLYSGQKRGGQVTNMDLVGRNGTMIPLDMKVTGPHNVVTSATFTNAQFLLQNTTYFSNDQFYSIDPGANIHFSDNVLLHVQANFSRSWINRQRPGLLLNSPFTTIQYSNPQGGVPGWTLPSGTSLNDPNLGWTWNRVNIQNQKRKSTEKGFAADLRIGGSDNNIMAGFRYDQQAEQTKAFDNSSAWQQLICSGFSDVCKGGPGSLIPTNQIPQYLIPGPLGFIDFNSNKVFANTDYNALAANAPLAAADVQGVATGGYEDNDWGIYFEANTTANVLNNPLHINAGVRYVKTREELNGLFETGTSNEALENNEVVAIDDYTTRQFSTRYDNILPSFNMAWDLPHNVVLRLAASRTMTRPDPSNMLPTLNFSDPSAENATEGNPNLTPFSSSNFDLAGEWYTGGMGYVALDVFTKHITGFTVNGIETIPFTSLGLPFASLTAEQQAAIDLRGGPNFATVNVQTQVNSDTKLTIDGEEVDWVQPLNWVTPGLGFLASFSHIHQMAPASSGGIATIAPGIAPILWKGSVFYERGPVSVHLMYDRTAGGIASGSNQNGLPFASLLFGPHQEVDLSASYTFENVLSHPQIVVDALNLTNSSISTYFGTNDALYSRAYPGRTLMLAVRGSF